MKAIGIILITVLLISCTKDQELTSAELQQQAEEYFLDFTIKNNVYNEDEQETLEVNSNQIVQKKMTFMDIFHSDHRYPYFHQDNTPSDSIIIVGSLRFETKNAFWEMEAIEFDIIFTESLKNLDALSDTTYQFKSNFKLYEQLVNNDFGQGNLFNTDSFSSIFISLPRRQ